MDIGTPLIEVTLTEEEAVDGYRMWFLIPVKGRRLLAPVALDMHRPWNSGGPSTAICVLPESDRLPVGPGFHEAPVAACRCGLYAMGELNAVVGGGGMDWEERLRSAVLGRARLWGRTMAGPNGWRAEFARITELLSLPGQEETVREVASVYGVPVKLLPEPVRFEGGPLEGTIRFGTPTVDSFISTFHDYSFIPDHDWEAGPEEGMIDEGLSSPVRSHERRRADPRERGARDYRRLRAARKPPACARADRSGAERLALVLVAARPRVPRRAGDVFGRDPWFSVKRLDWVSHFGSWTPWNPPGPDVGWQGAHGLFGPAQAGGTYQFRARLRNVASGKASGFSPAKTVDVPV